MWSRWRCAGGSESSSSSTPSTGRGVRGTAARDSGDHGGCPRRPASGEGVMISRTRFNVSVSVDEQTGQVMAVYFQVRDGDAAETREVPEGRAFADYDQQGQLLGVELLAPCGADVFDSIAAQEPEEVRQFFRRTAPREMVP